MPVFDGQEADDAVGYILMLSDLYRDCQTRHNAAVAL